MKRLSQFWSAEEISSLIVQVLCLFPLTLPSVAVEKGVATVPVSGPSEKTSTADSADQPVGTSGPVNIAYAHKATCCGQ
jgi:hypothetical protein